MPSVYGFFRGIIVSLLLCCLMILSGCPDYGRHYNAECIKMLRAKRGVYDMQFYCNIDVLAKVISRIGTGIATRYEVYFAEEDDGGVKEAFENKRMLLRNDIFIHGTALEKETPSWEHLFILREVDSNRCGFFLIRPHNFFRSMDDYPDSAYFFDWESAIKAECARRGIRVLEK